MAAPFLVAVVVSLLAASLHIGVRSQEMIRHVAKEGDDVTLHWNFKLEGLEQVRRDGEINARVTLGGKVDIAASLTQSVKATVGPEMSGLTVTLLSVTTSSAGVYAFFRNRGAEVLERQLLIVQVKPDKPTIGPTPRPFVVGREITLTCNSKSNSRPVNHSLPLTFTWSVTPPGGRRDGNTYVITAPPQQRNTTFNFRCLAREGDLESEDSDLHSLTPQYGPLDVKVTSSPAASSQGEVKVREGQPLTLTCTADCRPGCRVEWKDRKMAVVGDRGAYMVTSTGRSHYGAYQCSVGNQFGNDTRNVMVDLQYTPASVTFAMEIGLTFAGGFFVGGAVCGVVCLLVFKRRLRCKGQGSRQESHYAGLQSGTRDPPRDNALYRELNVYEVPQ